MLSTTIMANTHISKAAPICITGGAGFIGTSLIRSLLKKNMYRISVIDLREPANDISRHIRFFKGDFADSAILDDALEKNTILIHLGGISNQATSEKNHFRDVEINIVGTLKLLNAAKEKYISKIIFMSSAPSVYGNQKHLPVSETSLPNPISMHGIMKLTVEHYIKHYACNHGFSYVNLRSVNIYGPGQLAETHGVVSRFASRILNGKLIEVWGTPHITRDFLYIEDFVEAMEKLLNPDVKNITLNIASGKKTKLGDLIKIIEKVSGKTAEIQYQDIRNIDMPAISFSTKEVKKILGWQAKTPLDEGVRKTVEWLKNLKT